MIIGDGNRKKYYQDLAGRLGIWKSDFYWLGWEWKVSRLL
jgi:hypothetical protein